MQTRSLLFYVRFIGFTISLAGAGLFIGCGATPGNADASGGGSGAMPGSGGATAGSGGATSGSGGATSGSGGATSGSGGATAGTGGHGGSGGSTAGTGGRTNGSGGAANGTGGAAGGSGGGAGSGGVTASSGGRGGGGRGGSASGGAGTGGAGASGATGGSGATACGSTALNPTPFGCSFAWGRNDPGGSLTSYSYLQFMSYWVESGVKADGSFPSCNGCTWLSNQVSKTNLIPVYYAYFIGYYGHANGLPDGNTGGPPNLTTGGAALIRAHRDTIIGMYRTYAQQTAQVWKTKPLVWLLEGDFIQYSSDSMSQVDSSNKQDGLSFTELAQLAADITCAIKVAMPNAVVAINHSTWDSDGATNGMWGAMKSVNYDMVWTTGQATANGFFDSGTNSSSYNGATATFAYLHQLTGKTIFVDTSFGASAMGDSWSNATAAQLNARIADGVVAANVTGAVPSGYQAAISAVASSLNMTCR